MYTQKPLSPKLDLPYFRLANTTDEQPGKEVRTVEKELSCDENEEFRLMTEVQWSKKWF